MLGSITTHFHCPSSIRWKSVPSKTQYGCLKQRYIYLWEKCLKWFSTQHLNSDRRRGGVGGVWREGGSGRCCPCVSSLHCCSVLIGNQRLLHLHLLPSCPRHHRVSVSSENKTRTMETLMRDQTSFQSTFSETSPWVFSCQSTPDLGLHSVKTVFSPLKPLPSHFQEPKEP